MERVHAVPDVAALTAILAEAGQSTTDLNGMAAGQL